MGGTLIRLVDQGHEVGGRTAAWLPFQPQQAPLQPHHYLPPPPHRHAELAPDAPHHPPTHLPTHNRRCMWATRPAATSRCGTRTRCALQTLRCRCADRVAQLPGSFRGLRCLLRSRPGVAGMGRDARGGAGWRHVQPQAEGLWCLLASQPATFACPPPAVWRRHGAGHEPHRGGGPPHRGRPAGQAAGGGTGGSTVGLGRTAWGCTGGCEEAVAACRRREGEGALAAPADMPGRRCSPELRPGTCPFPPTFLSYPLPRPRRRWTARRCCEPRRSSASARRGRVGGAATGRPSAAAGGWLRLTAAGEGAGALQLGRPAAGALSGNTQPAAGALPGPDQLSSGLYSPCAVPAAAAGRTCGADVANLHFLDMPFYQTGGWRAGSHHSRFHQHASSWQQLAPGPD